jgi:hypothetical protein
MAGTHPKMEAWDALVQEALAATDRRMEEVFGQNAKLRENRPAHGQTWNPQSSGLFNVRLDFTTGAGSELGPGYVLDLEVAGYDEPDGITRKRYIEACRIILQEELDARLPGRSLRFERDGAVWKLQGDFSLGGV